MDLKNNYISIETIADYCYGDMNQLDENVLEKFLEQYPEWQISIDDFTELMFKKNMPKTELLVFLQIKKEENFKNLFPEQKNIFTNRYLKIGYAATLFLLFGILIFMVDSQNKLNVAEKKLMQKDSIIVDMNTVNNNINIEKDLLENQMTEYKKQINNLSNDNIEKDLLEKQIAKYKEQINILKKNNNIEKDLLEKQMAECKEQINILKNNNNIEKDLLEKQMAECKEELEIIIFKKELESKIAKCKEEIYTLKNDIEKDLLENNRTKYKEQINIFRNINIFKNINIVNYLFEKQIAKIKKELENKMIEHKEEVDNFKGKLGNRIKYKGEVDNFKNNNKSSLKNIAQNEVFEFLFLTNIKELTDSDNDNEIDNKEYMETTIKKIEYEKNNDCRTYINIARTALLFLKEDTNNIEMIDKAEISIQYVINRENYCYENQRQAALLLFAYVQLYKENKYTALFYLNILLKEKYKKNDIYHKAKKLKEKLISTD